MKYKIHSDADMYDKYTVMQFMCSDNQTGVQCYCIHYS